MLSVGGAGAIDGLAGIFPRVMVELYDLYTSERGSREEMRKLQYEVSAAEELIVKWGVPGIKEGVAKVLGMGHKDGTRLPIRGVLPDGA